ncbi:MAG: hypothetical protein AMJ42_05030, partial [Deltaproteobacteria bacterium DG_8]
LILYEIVNAVYTKVGSKKNVKLFQPFDNLSISFKLHQVPSLGRHSHRSYILSITVHPQMPGL